MVTPLSVLQTRAFVFVYVLSSATASQEAGMDDTPEPGRVCIVGYSVGALDGKTEQLGIVMLPVNPGQRANLLPPK